MEEVVEGVECSVCESHDTVLFQGKWTPQYEDDGRQTLMVVAYKDPNVYAMRCAQCGRHSHVEAVATVLED